MGGALLLDFYHNMIILTYLVIIVQCTLSLSLSLLAASWTMSREGRAAFLAERIEGAQHFDIDTVADQTSPYPHMVPSEEEFQEHVGKVGCLPLLLPAPASINPSTSIYSFPPISLPSSLSNLLYVYHIFLPLHSLLSLLSALTCTHTHAHTHTHTHTHTLTHSWEWAVRIMWWCMTTTVVE